MVADIRPWYRAASVLLLPSDNEPFGRVLIEAMASGVPVVATRGGGVPELIADGREGFLVELGNAAEMSHAMQTILNEDGLRKSFSGQARKKAESFQLQAHVKQMNTIFNRMKNKRKSNGN
jgi:glycosyltransferase involved in cell wall biosynthesis